MSEAQRKKWIDLVKCIAILVVMVNHSGLDAGQVKFWGGMFFVPVFFVVSGFTYQSREESFAKFLGRKAGRLLLPYIAANGILFAFFAFKDVFLRDGNLSDMWIDFLGILYARNRLFSWETPTLLFSGGNANVFFYEILNSPTWFLPALFLTIVLFEGLVRMTGRNGRKLLLAAVILLCMANLYHYLFPLLLPWSIDALAYFLMMFLWGYFMRRKDFLAYFDRHKWILCILFGVFLVFALINGSANYSIGDYGKSAMMALYNALVSSTVLVFVCYKSERFIPRWLTLPGRHSMWILCYHLFVFEMLKAVFPNMHPGIMIWITAALLTVAGIGKEKLIHAKK